MCPALRGGWSIDLLYKTRGESELYEIIGEKCKYVCNQCSISTMLSYIGINLRQSLPYHNYLPKISFSSDSHLLFSPLSLYFLRNPAR